MGARRQSLKRQELPCEADDTSGDSGKPTVRDRPGLGTSGSPPHRQGTAEACEGAAAVFLSDPPPSPWTPPALLRSVVLSCVWDVGRRGRPMSLCNNPYVKSNKEDCVRKTTVL